MPEAITASTAARSSAPKTGFAGGMNASSIYFSTSFKVVLEFESVTS